MPRNGSGTYALPAGNPVSTGTTISSTVNNNTMSDIATALTQSVSKDGQTPMTANLPIGGFKLTNVGAGTSATDGATIGGAETLTNKTLTSPVITLLDANFTIQDNVDPTKQVKFEASGITTGTTRTVTIPDANITLARTDAAQTFTGVQTFGSLPVFTSGIGSTTATTQTANDNSTKVATTAYADAGATAATTPQASTGEISAESAVTKYISPDRLKSNPRIPNAWVRYSSNTPTITSSFNVTSLTRNGTGDISINFTNNMSSSNYGFTASTIQVTGGNNSAVTFVSASASSLRVIGQSTANGVAQDASFFAISVFGG